MKTESERLKILMRSFERAEERVRSVLIKTTADNVEDLRLKISKKLDRVTVELTQASVQWAENDLPVAFREGERRIDGHITAGAAVNDTTVENSYIQLARNVQHASEHAKSLVDTAIKEAESSDGYGATVGGVKQAIEEALAKENASMTITYSNGAKVPLSSYAEMLARTSRIMTSNEGAFNRCHELGIDLVYCVPVDNCCPYCKRYEGKVYSISGKDKRFPALYETALSSGYDIMHPNCRHEFVPFIEDAYSPEELEEMIKKSNEFPEYSKDDKLFRIYNRNQALLRQWNDERREFDKMKIVLGKDMPYTTLGGFRRARRTKSEQYLSIIKQAEDVAQYKEWQKTLDKSEMPETLDEFLYLKYNKKNEFEFLKGFKEYKSEYPDASREEYEVIAEIKKTGLKGNPSLRVERIDTSEYSFNGDHINKTDHQRNITREQAVSFIDNAVFELRQWKGKRIAYYSPEGATVVDIDKKTIVTTFSKVDYKESVKIALQEVEKWKK